MRRAARLQRSRRRFSALLALREWKPQPSQTVTGTQNMRDQLIIEPIGVLETPFREPAGTPIQPSRASGAIGRVRMDPRFHAGIKDLEGFERIWLIYWLHRASGFNLVVRPFLDQCQHGVFATRAPARPSPIGISAVRLLAIQDNVLEVADVDMVDGTPLLDIKPYVPAFDCYPGSKAGWFDASTSNRRLADDRFDRTSPGKAPGGQD
jgi:tRNA (adenine37-N6)-methyltransferase